MKTTLLILFALSLSGSAFAGKKKCTKLKDPEKKVQHTVKKIFTKLKKKAPLTETVSILNSNPSMTPQEATHALKLLAENISCEDSDFITVYIKLSELGADQSLTVKENGYSMTLLGILSQQ